MTDAKSFADFSFCENSRECLITQTRMGLPKIYVKAHIYTLCKIRLVGLAVHPSLETSRQYTTAPMGKIGRKQGVKQVN